MEMAGTLLAEFRIDFQNQECNSEFVLCFAAYPINNEKSQVHPEKGMFKF